MISSTKNARFQIVGVNYVDIAAVDHQRALRFYTDVFGPPEYEEGPEVHGWRLGRTWLTIFPAADGVTSNVGFSIEVKTPQEALRLSKAFVRAGGTAAKPRLTWMYERMRYCQVTDAVGTRLLSHCPMPLKAKPQRRAGKKK